MDERGCPDASDRGAKWRAGLADKRNDRKDGAGGCWEGLTRIGLPGFHLWPRQTAGSRGARTHRQVRPKPASQPAASRPDARQAGAWTGARRAGGRAGRSGWAGAAGAGRGVGRAGRGRVPAGARATERREGGRAQAAVDPRPGEAPGAERSGRARWGSSGPGGFGGSEVMRARAQRPAAPPARPGPGPGRGRPGRGSGGCRVGPGPGPGAKGSARAEERLGGGSAAPRPGWLPLRAPRRQPASRRPGGSGRAGREAAWEEPARRCGTRGNRVCGSPLAEAGVLGPRTTGRCRRARGVPFLEEKGRSSRGAPACGAARPGIRSPAARALSLHFLVAPGLLRLAGLKGSVTCEAPGAHL